MSNIIRYFLVIVLIACGIGFLKLDYYYHETYKNLKPSAPRWEFKIGRNGVAPPFMCKPNTIYTFWSRQGFKAAYIGTRGYNLSRSHERSFWVCFPKERTVQCICGTWNDMIIPTGRMTVSEGVREGNRLD